MSRSQGGSAVVEFALVLPLILLLILALVEVAVTVRVQLELVHAAREGARVAASVPDPAEAASAARRALGDRGREAVVRVTRPHAVGATASVRIELAHRVRIPLLGFIEVPLGARMSMRVER